MAKVKVIANHHSGGTMYKIGDEREVPEAIAADLKRNGLVEWEGEASKKEEGQKVNVTEKFTKEPAAGTSEKVQKNENGTNKKS